MKRLLVAGAAVFALCPFSGFAATFTVTNTFDSGAGSLNQAIQDANASAGANTIAFNIPGGGAQIIEPFTRLPVVTNQVTIDGTTQPGYAGAPLVVLNGADGIDALTLSAPGCAIKGIVFGGFGQASFRPHAALALLSPSNIVTACYIGVNETGAAVRFNDTAGILISNASGNVIGGLGASNRNLIGGNLTGVFITGPNASNNVILGNWFSLSQDGSTTLPNNPTDIIISNAPNNTVGGTIAAARNVFDAEETDILVTGAAASNAILGNYVNMLPNGKPATNATGFQDGILVQNAIGTVIGGTTAGARNVISGCDTGVQILNSNTSGTVVQGNYLGTDPTGMTGEFNYESVSIQSSAGNLIGGSTPGAGNVIVAEGFGAVAIDNASSNFVQGNFIGTDATGTNALHATNGTVTAGVIISAYSIPATGNLIGGLTPGASNVVAGLTSDGVYIGGAAASNNIVQGNSIGVAADGKTPLGNAGNGVDVYGSSSNLITANVIANNGTGGASGVYLYYVSSNNLVTGNIIVSNIGDGVVFFGPNPITQNSIYGNGGLALDPNGAGFMANTPGGSHNYPVITAVTKGSTDTTCTLNALGNSMCVAECYANDTDGNNCQQFLCSQQVTCDGSGNATFTFPCPQDVPYGSWITCFALYADGEASLVGPAFQYEAPINKCPPITIQLFGDDSTNFNGFVGAHYHWDFSESSMSGNYAFSVANESDLPPDLEFSPGARQGFLFGEFEKPGTYTVIVTATDVNTLCKYSQPFTIVITDPPLFPILSQASSQANTLFAGNNLHPISSFTGELYDFLPPDLQLGGPMPLGFRRYYAAFLKKDGLIAGSLGDNWLHNFEMKLTVTSSNTVSVVNNLGRFIQFTNSGGAFALISRPDVPFQLATNGSNYVLGDPGSQVLFTFDSSGKLIAIADAHGNAQALSYNGTQLTSVSDGLGRMLTFRYGSSGFLTNVSDGTRSVGFVQTGNNLTSATDALGFVTTYTYDTGNPMPGLMTATAEPQGNVPYSQVFNTNGQVTSQTEAGTNTTTLVYSNLSTTLSDPLGNLRTDTHTELGELASFTDETGQTIFTGSDDHGRRNAVVDRLGNFTTLGFHAPSGKPAAITNADGTVTLFNYAARMNSNIVLYDLSQVIYPDGTMESFTYDPSGNVLARTDRAGKVFSFSYNSRGLVLTATNPLGGVITSTYDVSGRLATRMDTDVGLTTFQYDSLSRLTNVIHPDSTSIQSTFDANDRLLSVIDERGNTTRFAYDQNNRLISMTDANLQVTHFAYDSRDRLVQATDRLGHSLGFSYDTLDHVATVTNRNGNVTTFTYDSRRRLASIADPGGKVWSFGYDNEAIPASSTNPLGQTDSQAVNLLGYPVAFTNALGQVSSVARDSMERTTNAVDEISRTNGFGYEARGLLASATAPLIGTAAYQRNNLGLLSAITGLNGEQWSFAYTPMGRLQSLADPLNRTNAYSYDNRGRLQRVVFADGVMRSNSYDQASNPTRRQYSSGPDLQFTYDSLNRLASANDLSFAYDAEGRVTNTISSGVNQGATYDAGGRLTSISYQNGALTVNYAYDSRDRLTQVGDTLTGTQINFNYDDAGRLTGITRPNGVNGTYTHDAAGRLTRIQEGAIIDIQYGYDAASEITNANFTAPLDPATLLAPAIPTFAYDAAHQIKNSGYGFDARGRQTASPGHTYQWDGASRLIGIDSVALAYNGANDIETRATGGVTTRYFYNHALGLTPIMAERNETTLQIQRYYVWTPGGQLLYLIDAASGNAVRFFHYDRVGSTLALTSGAGAVADAYAYSPYGVLLGHTGTSVQPFTYIGEFGVRAETTANLYHMRARYYDPVSARFLTRDSFWPRLADNRTLGPYTYANESPLLFIDPQGRKDEDPADLYLAAMFKPAFVKDEPTEVESTDYSTKSGGFNPVPPSDEANLPGSDESRGFTYTGDEGATEVSPPLLLPGAAADVIEAYARTHIGKAPSHELVRQILMSTATDLTAPAVEQGCGLLNIGEAVRMASALPGHKWGAPFATSPAGSCPGNFPVTQAPKPYCFISWMYQVNPPGSDSFSGGSACEIWARGQSRLGYTLDVNPPLCHGQ